MDQVGAFFAVMAALSAAVQTLVEHVVKQNSLLSGWFDDPKDDAGKERLRRISIHAAAFAIGTVLAWSLGLTPLEYLGVQRGPLVNAVTAGILVSFGGSFFDEALGAVREFKKAQESVAKTRDEETRKLKAEVAALRAQIGGAKQHA